MLSDEINVTYAALIASRAMLADAQVDKIEAQFALDNKKSDLLLSGSIDGKNAETRDAQMRQQAEQEYLNLTEAEITVTERQANYDRDYYAYESRKYQVRLLEAMKP